MDANLEWLLREIIGEEDADGVPHYLVDWCPSLIPKHSMEHAAELVAKFEAREARIRAQRRVQASRGDDQR
jgi:hypothetical protein